MAEEADCEIHDAFQEGGIDTLQLYRKNRIPRQVLTDTNYYILQCLKSPLGLHPSVFKEDNSKGANKLSIQESETLSKEYHNNTAKSKITSVNNESYILRLNIKTKRQRCEIHDGFINSLSSISKNGSNKYKDGEHTDITLGKERKGCPNIRTIGKIKASFGKLLRIGSLEGNVWKMIVPQKMCHLVHADSCFTSKGISTIKNPTTMSQVQLCEEKNGKTLHYNDSLILVDVFEDNSHIATLINYEVLDSDLKELIYHIKCVANFGFDHIIIIGETDYGMIFLDCYGRVFLWENESQMLWPLGNSPEEASKRLVKEIDQLRWFEDNGTVYEYITKWEDYY
ncbi:hypothetical protein C1645_833798 [Glomus cerebriforme]|uniref:Uncharacterized protein n=1 Tax=Glomus cerebriforme TaxID=658196 RepID=A0A397SAW3_9GLOM|nr:hypothetical protein C1645_833798 [Glomus cerebriforme]